jgi:hypothetical protein
MHHTYSWNTCTYVLAYFSEQSYSWEVDWFSAGQEIHRILWNPNVHYHINNSLPPVPTLSHINPVYTPRSHFLKIHLIIILLSKPGSLSLRFPHHTPVHTNPLPIRTTCPVNLILLHFITRKILGEQYRSLGSALYNFLHFRYLVPLRSNYIYIYICKCVCVCVCGPGSVVGIATAYGLDGPEFDSWWGRDFPHLSRPAQRPTQRPVRCVPGLSRGCGVAGAWRWPLTPF